MKKSIQKFIKNPKNTFLIDGLGALLSFLLLFFALRNFSTYIGLSKTILTYLSLIALFFSLYSISCFVLLNTIWKPYLKGICIGNALYCILTLAVILYYFESISALGLLYFLGEIIIISCIIAIEIKTIRNHIPKE